MAHYRFYRKDEPDTKKNWRTQAAPLTHIHTLCAFSEIVGLQTSNFLTFPFSECPLILITEQQRSPDRSGQTLYFFFFFASSEHSDLQRAGGEGMERRKKGARFIKIRAAHRGSVKLFCDISTPLPLLFSPPLIFVSVSPLLSCLCVFSLYLHFEPNSVHLPGKLQMFWVNYGNHKEVKLKDHWASALFYNSSCYKIKLKSIRFIKESSTLWL